MLEIQREPTALVLRLFRGNGTPLGDPFSVDVECSDPKVLSLLGDQVALGCGDERLVLISLSAMRVEAVAPMPELLEGRSLSGLFSVQGGPPGQPMQVEYSAVTSDEQPGLFEGSVYLERFSDRLERRQGALAVAQFNKFSGTSLDSGHWDGSFVLSHGVPATGPCSRRGPHFVLHGIDGDPLNELGNRAERVERTGEWRSLQIESGCFGLQAEARIRDPITGRVGKGVVLPGQFPPVWNSLESLTRDGSERFFVQPLLDGVELVPRLDIADFGYRGDACIESPNRVCLGNGRFEVTVAWRDPHRGHQGLANLVRMSDDSLYGTFFSEGNVELVLKILDGTTFNDHHWLFYSGLTTLDLEISVRDLVTGRWRRLSNPPGQIKSFVDIESFSDGDGIAKPIPVERVGSAPAPPPGAFQASGESLELHGFEFSVAWKTGQEEGKGQALSFSEDAGFFWFFQEENPELIVKLLDGRAINGHYWLFVGGLSDVNFTLALRKAGSDPTEPPQRSWVNESGELRSFVDLEAVPGQF